MNDPQQSDDRDTAISRLYHDAAGETPPPSLDAAVLQRARAAVGDAPARASRWSWGAWQAQFAVLATVVISFTLLLVSQQAAQQPPAMNEGTDETRTLRDIGSDQAVRPQAAPASPVPPREKVQSGRSPDASGVPAAASAPAPAPANAAEAMSKIVVPAPSEPARPAPPTAAPSASPAPATPPALAQPAPPAAPAAETARALQRAPDAEGRARDAVPAAAARAGAGANAGSSAATAERAAPARPMDEWIARIRELRKQGQAAEAARELEALRKQYPAARLPEDLLAP